MVAGVGDGQRQCVTQALQLESNMPLWPVVFHGVAVQVMHQLLDQNRVAMPDDAWGNIGLNTDVVLKGGGIFGQLLQKTADVEVFALREQDFGVCARERQ